MTPLTPEQVKEIRAKVELSGDDVPNVLDTIDSLRAQLAQEQAGAAALREAGTELLTLMEWASEQRAMPDDAAEKREPVAKAAWQAALASDAGRAMAERIKLLEAVAEAVEKMAVAGLNDATITGMGFIESLSSLFSLVRKFREVGK